MESLALDTLDQNKLDVFTTKDLKHLLHLDKTQTYNLIKSLKKKSHIEMEKRGLYSIKGTDEMIKATRYVFPSYISFLSALNYYGLTDYTPVKVTLVTSNNKIGIKLICAIIGKDKFFGYTSVGKIIIAEKEKALIDSLYLPKYAGGMKEVMHCFSKAKNLDWNKLYNYALKMNSKIVLRRLGYISEQMGLKIHKKLHEKIGKGYELFDLSGEKKGNYNKKWLLDVNI